MLDFGWQVSADDTGDLGTVVAATFDITSRRLTGVVVRRGAFATRDIVIPAGYIVSSVDGIVTISIDESELEKLEDFRVRRYVLPEADMQPPQQVDPPGVVVGTTPAITTGNPLNPWTVGGAPLVEETGGNVPEGSMALSDGQEVYDSEAVRLGTVERLLVSGDTLTGIVVRPEEVFGSGRDVPAELIVATSTDELQLGMSAEEFGRLPEAPAS